MKVKVNRALSQGKYRINFEVGGFTSDELSKMASFGVPTISMKWMNGTTLTTSPIGLNQISNGLEAVFPSEELAKQYEDQVLTQIRNSMQSLRERNDGFSSTQEVDL